MKKTIATISIESQEVIRRLEKCEIGDFVSYKELSDIALGDIQNEKRHALHTARNRLQHDKNMVFGIVRNQGVRRLNDQEIVADSKASLIKMNRESRRAAQRLSCVDFERLPGESQVQHNARMTIFAALSYMVRPKSQTLIEERVKVAQSQLDMKDTLRLFGVEQT